VNNNLYRLRRRLAADVELCRGSPVPLGATVRPDGVNFAVASRYATSVTLLLCIPGEQNAVAELPLDGRFHRTGEVWHAFLKGLDPGIQYAYRMDRVPNPAPHLQRFDPRWQLLDPYAQALTGGAGCGVPPRGRRGPRRGLVVHDAFDWGDDEPPRIRPVEAIIYELHVRGFTQHPSSGVSRPGMFAGLVEKIPYLQALGVNTVELLPVWAFEEADSDRMNPFTGERLLDYWGYDPIAFFAPHAAYASRTGGGEPLREFKEMVKSLHAAGIAVVLDVVLNHTAEGNERGPTYAFRGIDNTIYYLVDPDTGAYRDYTGTGNTLNCNHPRVRELIIDVLRYWVAEMHVDGFRFDLASILGRGEDGSVLANPPVIEQIAEDPVLRQTALIAEAWDAAGLYQVGHFSAGGRWAEWNGKFRDDVRRFVKSDPGMVSALATRLVGSPDLYQTSGRRPCQSLNFITCHDGFTLADLVAYNGKHNEANDEGNADGSNDNLSWNCGSEGPTDAEEINRLRRRQVRNFATVLLISAGTPMVLAGDEFGRTQLGNNNAYCQDNETSWVDWRLLDANADLFRFFQLLIRFRRAHPLLRSDDFDLDAEDGARHIAWHGVELGKPDWSWESRALAMHLYGMDGGEAEDIYFIANAHWEGHVFELPHLPERRWCRVVDTMQMPPHDIAEPGAEEVLADQRRYVVGPRSVVVLIGKGCTPS
jgi:glycogen operon protein